MFLNKPYETKMNFKNPNMPHNISKYMFNIPWNNHVATDFATKWIYMLVFTFKIQ
jgi:hypothetical protein